jgi:hypothetical protein
VHQVFKSSSSVLELFLFFVSDCALSNVNHYCVVNNSITFPPPTNFWLPTKRKLWGPYGFQSNVAYAYVRLSAAVCIASSRNTITQYQYATLHKLSRIALYIYTIITLMSIVLAHDSVSLRLYIHIPNNLT